MSDMIDAPTMRGPRRARRTGDHIQVAAAAPSPALGFTWTRCRSSSGI